MREPSARLRLAVAIVLVGAIVALTYRPVLRAQALSLDDVQFVTENPLVTNPSWGSAGRFFGEVVNPSTVQGYYLPLSMVSLMLDWAMGGRADDLAAFHRTSVLLHVLNTTLVLLILYRLFGSLIPAAIMALTFGLHPLTVQSVAWVGQRKVLLATCFALAAVLCYVQRGRAKERAWLAGAVGFYALALLSKPTVIALPALLLLLDGWPLKRFGRRAIVEKWPFVLLAFASGVVTIASLTHAVSLPSNPGFGWQRATMQVGYLVTFYLGKIAWPTGLTCIYAPPLPYAWSNPVVLASVLGALALALLALLSARRAPRLLVGLTFFFVALAPTFAVLKWSWVIAYDNYVYFPALGILLVLAHGATVAWNSRRPPGPAAKAALLAVGLVACAAEARATRATLGNWRDSITLWRDVVAKAPQAAMAHNGLGVALLERAATDDATRAFQRAIELDPELAEAQLNLGTVFVRQGRIDEAIPYLMTAQRLQPHEAYVPYQLGLAAQRAGKLAEAEAHFRRALELQPGLIEATNRLGTLLVLEGKHDDGVALLRRSVGETPTSAHAHFSLAMVLLYTRGRDPEALKHLELAIRYRREWVAPLNQLAWLKATDPDSSRRDGRGALELAERAVELTGHRDAESLDTEAAAFAATGRFDDAIATARRAIALAAASGADSLAQQMRQRLARYERHVPYTEAVVAGAPPAAR